MDVNTVNQSTTDEQMMDILLVLDKEKKTISAVKGVDENGELQTVPPENNSELLKFDRHGDFFSNFFSAASSSLTRSKSPAIKACSFCSYKSSRSFSYSCVRSDCA